MSNKNQSQALLLLGALWSGCNPAAAEDRSTKDEAPINVALVEVKTDEVPRHLTVVGSVRAHREADVAADVGGKLVMVDLERGARVEKGQAIARVDADRAAIDRAEAHAMAEAARVQREQAARDCERNERLLKEGAIRPADFDKMQASCESSVFSSDAADARARRAGKQISDATVRAPFDGIVGERFVDVGEYVMPGARIATIVQVDPLRVELGVPESAIAAVRADKKLSFSVAALHGTYEARVSHVSPSLRTNSRDLMVEALVTKGASDLRPGMFVTAKIEIGRAKLPLVPATALSGSGSSRRVFVASDGRLQERVVLTGETVGTLVAIESGLSAGDRIAAEIDEHVKDGVRIQH